jgi:hypothetical protein
MVTFVPGEIINQNIVKYANDEHRIASGSCLSIEPLHGIEHGTGGKR